ncbi:MAG: sigma factor [Ruminococcus callidus]
MKPVPFEQLPDQELVLLARNDRGAMESLVKRYTGAVWHQVRQFQGISEPEDLAQEGFLGLISAVCRYDFMRGVPFSAYAGKCITNSIGVCVAALPQFTVTCGGIGRLRFLSTGHRPAAEILWVQSRSQAAEMFCAMVNRLSAGISGLHADLRRSVYRTGCGTARNLCKSVDNALSVPDETSFGGVLQ